MRDGDWYLWNGSDRKLYDADGNEVKGMILDCSLLQGFVTLLVTRKEDGEQDCRGVVVKLPAPLRIGD